MRYNLTTNHFSGNADIADIADIAGNAKRLTAKSGAVFCPLQPAPPFNLLPTNHFSPSHRIRPLWNPQIARRMTR
jgi:hypothetical protein